jgi:hypothetical protein
MYSVQQGYDIKETYRRSGSNKRNCSPHHNMTNASALIQKLHGTIKPEIHRKMRQITGWETSEE